MIELVMELEDFEVTSVATKFPVFLSVWWFHYLIQTSIANDMQSVDLMRNSYIGVDPWVWTHCPVCYLKNVNLLYFYFLTNNQVVYKCAYKLLILQIMLSIMEFELIFTI
jgi:hypothetical protein